MYYIDFDVRGQIFDHPFNTYMFNLGSEDFFMLLRDGLNIHFGDSYDNVKRKLTKYLGAYASDENNIVDYRNKTYQGIKWDHMAFLSQNRKVSSRKRDNTVRGFASSLFMKFYPSIESAKEGREKIKNLFSPFFFKGGLGFKSSTDNFGFKRYDGDVWNDRGKLSIDIVPSNDNKKYAVELIYSIKE